MFFMPYKTPVVTDLVTYWIHNDLVNHPPLRLAHRKLIWSDMVPTNVVTQWREVWKSVSVVNHSLVTNPTIWQQGFDLPRRSWSKLNRFHTGQGQCAANLHKWHLATSDKCPCGEIQTMRHTVEACPLTKLADDCLLQLHSADDAAIKWLENKAMKCSQNVMNWLHLDNNVTESTTTGIC